MYELKNIEEVQEKDADVKISVEAKGKGGRQGWREREGGRAMTVYFTVVKIAHSKASPALPPKS